MQVYSAHTAERTPIEPVADERAVLLEEVDFKWLMAGQGWWVDTTRLHTDPGYARQLFDLVDGAPLAALKDCAALLQAHTGTRQLTGLGVNYPLTAPIVSPLTTYF